MLGCTRGGGGLVLMQPENPQKEKEVCPSICNLEKLLNMFSYNQVGFSWGLNGWQRRTLCWFLKWLVAACVMPLHTRAATQLGECFPFLNGDHQEFSKDRSSSVCNP